MDSEVRDLDRPFSDVFKALDLKEQRKAIRGALGKAAKRVKQITISNLQGSGLGMGTYAPITEGVQYRVFPSRYGAGFMVRVSPYKKGDDSVMHLNRRGKEKPVLMWAEDGTRGRRVGRRTDSFTGTSRNGKKVRHYNRAGHSTGRMPKYGFMVKEEGGQVSFVEHDLFADFQRNVLKAARKQGLL